MSTDSTLTDEDRRRIADQLDAIGADLRALLDSMNATLDENRPKVKTPPQEPRRITRRDWPIVAWVLSGPAALVLLALVAVLLLTGCATDRHPAPGYVVRDCKAALRAVVTDEGAIPAKPKVCDNVSPGQYKGAVADVTRKYRIG